MMCDGTGSERQLIIRDLQDFSLSYLSRLNNVGAQVFASLGLTYGQAMLLLSVERGHTTPSELSNLIGVVPQALSALVTKLVKAQLLERQSVSNDARRVFIALTQSGQNACAAVKSAWHEHFPFDLTGLNDEELKVMIEAVRIATKHRLI